MDFGVTIPSAVINHYTETVQIISLTNYRIEVTPDGFHCGHQILSGMASDWQQRKI